MKCPHCGKPVALVAAPEEATPPTDPSYLPAMDLEAALSEHLDVLDVIDIEGKLIIEPIRWIDDKDKWRRINKIIKAHGGTWIAGGKESHWEVPK